MEDPAVRRDFCMALGSIRELEGREVVDLVFDQQFIVTGTLWKFKTIVDNFGLLVQKKTHVLSRGIVRPIIDAKQVPVSVEEKDTMLGTSALIEEKAKDQVSAIQSGVVEGKLLGYPLIELIVQQGGWLATITTDVAGREADIHDLKTGMLDTTGERSTGKWKRILNLTYSERAKRSKETKLMLEELDISIKRGYAGKHGPMVRALDSTLAITTSHFQPRMKQDRQTGRYPPPDSVVVYPARETAGIVMDRHPLADPKLRNAFIERKIELGHQVGKTPKDVLLDFDGRAGWVKAEDLGEFCAEYGVPYELMLNGKTGNLSNDLERFRMLAEGGTYGLLARTIMTILATGGSRERGKFIVDTAPSSSDILRVH